MRESQTLIAKIEASYEEELSKARQELQATSTQITTFREQLSSITTPTTSTPHHFSPTQSNGHYISPPSPQFEPLFSPIPSDGDLLAASTLNQQPIFDNQSLNYTAGNNSFNNSINSTSNKPFGLASFNSTKTPLNATNPLPKSKLPLRAPQSHSATMPSPRSKPRASPAQPSVTHASNAYASPARAVDALVLEMKEKFALSNIVVPIEKVGDCIYKLGPRKLHLSVVKNRLMVRTSAGGYEDFIHFLAKMDTSSFRHLARD